MSYTQGLRHFGERPVPVKCPKCAYIANQRAAKLRKNTLLKCPHCGLEFLPSQCPRIGG